MTKLDSYDLKILSVLQRDGRISKVKLAEAVHLSPSSTWERLRRLEEAGVIAGYHARLDERKLDAALGRNRVRVIVEITLGLHRQTHFDLFENAIKAAPEVIECHATGGGIDYVMTVLSDSVDAYQCFMDSLLNADVGIDRYFSYIVTKPIKSGVEAVGEPNGLAPIRTS